MPRAAYRGPCRCVQVYIIERFGDRGVGEHRGRRAPLPLPPRVASPKRSSIPELSSTSDPAFAVVAARPDRDAARPARRRGPGPVRSTGPASRAALRRLGRAAAAAACRLRAAAARRGPCPSAATADRASIRCRSPRPASERSRCGATVLSRRTQEVRARPQPPATTASAMQPTRLTAPSRSGHSTSPSSWTSGSSTTPKRSWTRRRPSAISSSTSAVVASPVFSTKLACFSEKRAPPTAQAAAAGRLEQLAGACAPRPAGPRGS